MSKAATKTYHPFQQKVHRIRRQMYINIAQKAHLNYSILCFVII